MPENNNETDKSSQEETSLMDTFLTRLKEKGLMNENGDWLENKRSYKTEIQSNGELILSKEYTNLIDLQAEDKALIKLTNNGFRVMPYVEKIFIESNPPLKGNDLLKKIQELKELPEMQDEENTSELVKGCGYVYKTQEGKETIDFEAYYEALLVAKGVQLDISSFITNADMNGIIIPKEYTEKKGLKTGDKFQIEVGRKDISLVPINNERRPIAKEWAVSGKYLIKAIDDLEDWGADESSFPELCGYSDGPQLKEAIEAAKKIQSIKRTPRNSQYFDNPDYNFIPDYFVINDCLAHTLYEEMILFMTKEFFDKHREDDDWGYDLEWEELEGDEDDYVFQRIGKEAFDAFEKPMVTTFISRLIYADGESVEFDDVLDHYGGLKKHFLDLDNSYWYGRSFAAHHNPGVQTPFGLELKE